MSTDRFRYKHVVSFPPVRTLGTIVLSALGSMWALPALALTQIQIEESVAVSQVPQISVPGGHSVVLSFENARYMQSIWIDDPTIIGVVTNRPLCDSPSSSTDCGYATAARFRRLNGLLPLDGFSFRQGEARATVVSITTTDASGGDPEIYQFQLNTGQSVSSNVSLVAIVNDVVPSPSPRLPARTVARTELNVSMIRRGHDVALNSGMADVSSDAWLALEQFLTLVDVGLGVSLAIRQSAVPSALLSELEKLGHVEGAGDRVETSIGVGSRTGEI